MNSVKKSRGSNEFFYRSAITATVELIVSFLSNRSQQCKVNGILSEPVNIDLSII